MKKSLILWLVLCTSTPTFAAEMRQIINEDGSYYSVDPVTHRVYSCVSVATTTEQRIENGVPVTVSNQQAFCTVLNNDSYLAPEMNHSIQVSAPLHCLQ